MDTTRPHELPIQPLYTDEHGTVRFVPNRIVEHLLEVFPGGLNHLAEMPFSRADWVQFAQLIGYSLSGYGDLGYVDNETWETAARMSVDDPGEELKARNAYLRQKLRNIQEAAKELTTVSFQIHPDDLDPQ